MAAVCICILNSIKGVVQPIKSPLSNINSNTDCCLNGIFGAVMQRSSDSSLQNSFQGKGRVYKRGFSKFLCTSCLLKPLMGPG